MSRGTLRWSGVPLAAALLLAAAAGCIEKNRPADDDTTDIVEGCADPFDGEMHNVWDEIYNPDEIWRTHAEPKPGVLCFDCHLCANHGAKVVDSTHFVCNHCHDENGELNTTGSDCGCGDLDCDTDPPILTCGTCHTDGCNGMASAEQMNALCDFCHIEPGGGDR